MVIVKCLQICSPNDPVESLLLLTELNSISSSTQGDDDGPFCEEFILLKMSAENEKIKPKTDIELFLNNANQCVWKNLKNDSGAGANAASRVDMTFTATDPLSEIVWSPDKGLSLKCADSSFADKNSSLFRDVGTSCMVFAPPLNFTSGSSTTDKPIDVDFVKPIAVVCAKSDIAEADAPTMHPTGDSGVKVECKACEEDDIGSVGNKEKMNTAETAPNLPNDQSGNLMNNWEKITGDQANIGTDKISGIEGNKFSAISGQADQRPFDNLLLQSDENKPSLDQNPCLGRHSDGGVDIGIEKKAVVTDDDLHTEVEPIIEYKGSGAPGTNLTSSSRNPLEKLESSAENDLRTFNCEAACAGTSGVNEIENKLQDNEMMLPCDKILSVLHSPCHSRIHMAINKGKEKSLSDGDANVKLSREENDSHSSVESCNSAGFFPAGKKRRNFQQQLIVGSKSVKKQIEEASGSKSYVKQDSSFMNWISNMVKGLSRSIQNDSNTLALTLANPDHHNLRPDEKLIACNMNQDPETKNTGFKSIFQSIYCPSLKNVGTRVSHREGDSSEDLEPGNMEHGIDATPITCCAENNSLSKLCLQSNKFEVSTGRHDAGPSSQPKIKPLNFFNCQESSKNNPVETKNYSILGQSKDKEEVASHSSSTKQNTDNNDNIDSNALSDRREEENIPHKRDNLGSLWITRFSSKLTAPLREQPANATEASTDLKEDKGNNDHKSKYMFKPLSSSPGFRNLEPMASMFAMRFGAMKHIIPTNTADNTTQVNMLCLFCGTSGHQLSDCSSIAESKLEDLQKNIDSYGGLEEHPCLCIKCFQPNHWAISCTTSISTRKHELKANAFVNDSVKHFIPSNEESARRLTDEDDRVLSGGSINDETDHQAGQNINLKRKSNEIITFKVGSNASFKKYCGSSSEENKFRENPVTSPSKLAERQISHVPKEIFDAVKKLRLSRTDILKWINTHGSISQLDGFFLRLRLGKWEEGLGGTGYYVAYINETQRQYSEQNTRKSLSVKVGGIKCMVESQYISNHDFLEEEIMEWWSTTSEAGAEIPSEEDLIEKFKKKKILGL
ncbi:small subunit ribosomal protein S15e [Spatholobus suberectus]|nr:small subunit ribosomal protein S15e [Spatholobus suberectus]